MESRAHNYVVQKIIHRVHVCLGNFALSIVQLHINLFCYELTLYIGFSC